jgi:hypothetical protein
VTAADPREEIDLDRLAELEQAATDGPWSLEYDSEDREMAVSEPYPYAIHGPKNTTTGVSDEWITMYGEQVSEVCEFSAADAELIVALRNAAPDLIAAYAERDHLRATVERVRALHRRQDIPAHEPLRTKDGEVIADGIPARSICHHDRMAWPCQTFLTLGGDR